MSPGVAFVLVGVIVLATVALAISITTFRARYLRVKHDLDGSWVVRVPGGSAMARQVVHDERGRVIEARVKFRGEREEVVYFPPAPQMLASYMQRRSDERRADRAPARRTR